MAIYSLSHAAVGRTTHAEGTAGAHARYVTRDSAAREIVGEHMPTERQAARDWLNQQEAADRKNARVIDKVMLALPIELDAAERVALVRAFAAEVGRGRVAWLAGIHDRGRDAGNPHAHVLFRDRDFETGKRVVGFTEKGSTERLREIWERVANQALERAGHDARIDRRSLEAQGLAREAGIHVGPKALAMEERGVMPRSKPQLDPTGRVINWPEIDRGRSRIDYLAEIEAANDDREQERERGKTGKGRSAPPTPEAGPEPRPVLTAERIAAEEQRQEKLDELQQQRRRDDEIRLALHRLARTDQAAAATFVTPEQELRRNREPDGLAMAFARDLADQASPPPPVPEAELLAAREAHQARERQRQADAQEKARARSWVAQREGLEGLDARQRDGAERSFAAWREKAPKLAERSGFDLAAYVAFVQRKEAEREQARPEPVREPVKEPEQARAPQPESGKTPAGRVVAATPEQVPHRPSCEVGKAPEPPPAPEIAPERQREVSRLRLAVEKARERLEALGDRLERAFGRVREALERQRPAEPTPPATPPKAPEPEVWRGRRLFEDYSRGRELKRPGWD